MIATLHILGALLAFLLLSTLLVLIGGWLERATARQALEEASIDLAVPRSTLSSPSFEQHLIRYFAAKYSSDHFKNRASDLIGSLLTAFNWIVLAAELALLGFVTWFTVTGDQNTAVYAWLVLPISLAAWIVALVVYFVCKLLTGRFPAQARHGRRILAQSVTEASGPVA